jgi:hypothetical protein
VNEHDLCDLFEWSMNTKDRKLSKVESPLAKNLISQLLSKNPEYRPDVMHVLSHPFLTGNHALGRLPGQQAKFHVFISYRAAADKDIANLLYEKLTAAGVNVWLDTKRLEPGKHWQEEFVKGLADSKIFMPVLSREAINSASKPNQNFSALKSDSDCDNVLLEHRVALELKQRGMISYINPVLIGDRVAHSAAVGVCDDLFEAYSFKGSTACHPQLTSPVVVASVEEQLRTHLDRMGLGSPLVDSMTASDILSGICKFQAHFLVGQLSNALDTIVTDVSALALSNELGDQSNNSAVLNATRVEEDILKLRIEELLREKDELTQKYESVVARLNQGGGNSA